MSLEEAREADNDTIVMLSKGVAYACCAGSEPLVKRVYQQVCVWRGVSSQEDARKMRGRRGRGGGVAWYAVFLSHPVPVRCH